ncbi:hypothetical protein [Campylobacter geochelonis]|uniref:hypothetical protein n=1 Tax=Campylobacter geochelonis TaxID=1780362 RepID=UPI001A969F6E|nr:hypothetical protein [Campylobacter geochelonis]
MLCLVISALAFWLTSSALTTSLTSSISFVAFLNSFSKFDISDLKFFNASLVGVSRFSVEILDI